MKLPTFRQREYHRRHCVVTWRRGVHLGMKSKDGWKTPGIYGLEPGVCRGYEGITGGNCCDLVWFIVTVLKLKDGASRKRSVTVRVLMDMCL